MAILDIYSVSKLKITVFHSKTQLVIGIKSRKILIALQKAKLF